MISVFSEFKIILSEQRPQAKVLVFNLPAVHGHFALPQNSIKTKTL